MKNIYYKVFNHGFVCLKDYFGTDTDIVESARVSYGDGTKKTSNDRTLLRYLMRQRHTSPYEMAELKFHIGMPIHVHRQHIRHRTASTNEVSGRYSEIKDNFYSGYNLNLQATKNKQGRADEKIDNESDLLELENFQQSGFELYRKLLDKGVAREIARMHLPLNTYTYFYWKIDLHNLFHYLKLRCDSHAQYEIREYANCIASIVKELFPEAFQAWYDYVLMASNFTRLDKQLLLLISQRHIHQKTDAQLAKEIGMSTRELEEFSNKLIVEDEVDFNIKNFEVLENLNEN
jgi:thymidylate synthase (FAD)